MGFKENWKIFLCKVLGHYMKTPFRNSRPINKCLRCGYENRRYKIEGYNRRI